MQMILPMPDGKPGLVFMGSPEEIMKCFSILMNTAKNGGVMDDLSMMFLNSLIDNQQKGE